MPSVPPTGPDGGGALAGGEVRHREANKRQGSVIGLTPRSIGGGGSAGEVAGERRWRSRGGAAAGARTAVKIGAWLNNVLHGKLPCGLGKVLGGSLGLEDRRRSELGNGGPAAAAEARVAVKHRRC
jgi:hypothetical protein